jgi:hypothetical protein
MMIILGHDEQGRKAVNRKGKAALGIDYPALLGEICQLKKQMFRS